MTKPDTQRLLDLAYYEGVSRASRIRACGNHRLTHTDTLHAYERLREAVHLQEKFMNTSLQAVRDDWGSVDALIERSRMIKDAMQRVMLAGEHYDTIPGTDTLALLQKGAHKLTQLFHLTWSYQVQVIEQDNEHREVRAKCVLYHRGKPVAEKEALCTTKETKYRYRTENTGTEVPKAYWKKGKPPDMLGGEDYFPRKIDGRWLILHQFANRNIPDQYNTVHQMAQKRAYVSAVIAATAASDAFAPEPGDDESAAATRAHHESRSAPREPRAESTDRRVVILADLEDAAQSGESALLEAWQDLNEAERTLVGREFGRIQKTARSIKPLPEEDA